MVRGGPTLSIDRHAGDSGFARTGLDRTVGASAANRKIARMHTPSLSDDAYWRSTCTAAARRHLVAWLCTDEGQDAIERIVPELPLSPAQLRRLREREGRERADWLVSTAALRAPAAAKLGCDRLLVTNRGLQQSSDIQTARYKASQFPVGSAVVDLCCGVGGDAMALAERGPLVAIDRDATLCRFVAHNLGRSRSRSGTRSGSRAAAVLCAAAEQWEMPQGAWLHIDPDRRPDQRRVADPHRSEPPVDVIDAILARSAGGAIKLSPAAEIPPHWGSVGGREWISRSGTCRQQVVWFGTGTAAGTRAATLLDRDGRPHTMRVSGDEIASHAAAATAPAEWIFDFDPAVRAAGLSQTLGERLGLACLGGPAGFFTAANLPDDRAEVAALYQPFRVLWQGPVDDKKLRRLLVEWDVGVLEIKIRGVDLVAETLRRRLLKKRPREGGRSLSLLIGRVQSPGRTYAAVAERPNRAEHV